MPVTSPRARWHSCGNVEVVRAGGNGEVYGAIPPARHFGLTDRGRIAPGMRADLVLVSGDPTTDIRATAAIVDVWRRGARLERP
ncbi:amidohydrolase family protein [Pseudonocardia sp. DSM 110487]|nr:amidohydrolase family protein [Pseudonocardia sp. DSM 110487]